MIIEVLVELSNRNIDKTFDYLVPKGLEDKIKVGIRVLVSFGNQSLEGFVLKIKQEESSYELKEIEGIVDEDIILNQELLELGKYIKETTLSTLISSYQVMLPKALKAKRGVTINKKIDTYITLSEDFSWTKKEKDSQKEILLKLENNGRVLKSELNKISKSSVKTLLKNKQIIEIQEEVYRLNQSIKSEIKHPLTKVQEKVVSDIYQNKDQEKTFLLHGVTGSGKTEVYMELIERLLKDNKTSIVLVPEISLTEQIVSRFRNRFNNDIAILHSRLSDGEKYDEWRKIERKEVKIVIGARSAIFAPLENLGVIIIDEEHTSSYKQENTPKYSAIDIAKWRSKYHNCPLVLGSATPTLESYARAKKNVYTLLEMKERVGIRKLPQVEVIDMNQAMKNSKGHFSKELIKEIEKRLEANEQIMLLLNRRGYSSFISCKNCGYVEKCPRCDITLTYHKTSGMLRCHYCGYATKLIDECLECHEHSITNLGIGTEKIEEEIAKYFPSAKTVRMDFDTTSTKGSHEKIITAFKEHKYDILLGTQMIAKGLDFPDVTLVGVIQADTSLNIPDFRSSELTYQLLSQVAGRSGRGEKEGKVIIQTFNKDHYAIEFAKNHDYVGFYNKEMEIRRELGYPPYYYLAVLKILSKDYEQAKVESNKIREYLSNNLSKTIILGPSIASVFKVNNIYRFQIILKYKQEENLNLVLSNILEHYKTNSKVKIDVEFNPLHI
ncbi:MAG: primosomal protein N' [Firmicutes bacterium]|nr:primosomal protein N' [Bacillota bacterium]